MCGRITWLLPIVLLLTACDQRTPILRGEKLPPLPKAPALTESLPPEQSNPADDPGADTDRLDEEPVSLNLSLPDINWGDIQVGQQEPLMDDVFHRAGKERLVNWSGRLHLDESEEARTRPITDNILGAEVELQLRLP